MKERGSQVPNPERGLPGRGTHHSCRQSGKNRAAWSKQPVTTGCGRKKSPFQTRKSMRNGERAGCSHGRAGSGPRVQEHRLWEDGPGGPGGLKPALHPLEALWGPAGRPFHGYATATWALSWEPRPRGRRGGEVSCLPRRSESRVPALRVPWLLVAWEAPLRPGAMRALPLARGTAGTQGHTWGSGCHRRGARSPS